MGERENFFLLCHYEKITLDDIGEKKESAEKLKSFRRHFALHNVAFLKCGKLLGVI